MTATGGSSIRTAPSSAIVVRLDWEGARALVRALLLRPVPGSCDTHVMVGGRIGRIGLSAPAADTEGEPVLVVESGGDLLRARLDAAARAVLADSLLWGPAEGSAISMADSSGPQQVRVTASYSPLEPLYGVGSADARRLRWADAMEFFLSWSGRLAAYWPDDLHPLRVLPMPRPTFRSQDGNRVSFEQWRNAVANDAARVVARTSVGGGLVSTVCTGLDWRLRPSPEPAAIYETGVSVSSGPAAGFKVIARHATRAEAEKYHAEAPGKVGVAYFFPKLARPEEQAAYDRTVSPSLFWLSEFGPSLSGLGGR